MGEGPLGIVAGGGQFPLLCAKAARNLGRRVFAVAHHGETDERLGGEVDGITWIHLGQLGKLIKALKGAGVRETVFAGSIGKKRIFQDIRPDIRGIALWGRLRGRLDDEILRAVARELETDGIKVIPSTVFLQELLAPPGVLTRKSPTHAQEKDISFGWGLAKAVGHLDIGQCLVVKDRTVLAVEAIEGTDQAIARAGELGGPGAVVIKISKPRQDLRFDLPTVGHATIEGMARIRAAVLAIEAGKTLFFDRDEAVALADSKGIAIVSRQGEDMP